MAVNDKVNLAEKLSLVTEYWSPATVGHLNNYKIQVVRTKGEFTWHTHDETEEFFLVLSGEMVIQFRDRNVHLGQGELFVVPRTVEHCPKVDGECEVLLIEPAGTVNTGDAGGI